MEAAFRAWWQESYGLPPGPHAVMTHVAWGEHLLATRPKPPSLKKQALLQLEMLNADPAMHDKGCYLFQIRRALEQLDG